jgi:hypothetical protein
MHAHSVKGSHLGCYHRVEDDEREMRGGTGGPVHARVLDIFDRHRNIIFPHLEKVRRVGRGAGPRGAPPNQELFVIRGRDESSPLIEEGDGAARLEMIVILLTHCPCSDIPLRVIEVREGSRGGREVLT